MTRVFIVLMLACLIAPTLHARSVAQPSVPMETSYLRDPTGQAVLTDVKGSDAFTAYEGILSKGYDPHAAYWLKLRIPGNNAQIRSWILRIEPSWHDDIRIFDPSELNAPLRVTGDHYPWELSEFPSLSHAFILKSTPEPRYVYVRIQSAHSYQINVELSDQTSAERSEWIRMILLSLYLSSMIVIFLLALFNLSLHFDKTLAIFSVTQFTTILYSILAFGTARPLLDSFIPNISLDRAHIIVVILYTLAAMQFNRFLLENNGIKVWFRAPIFLVSFIPIICLALYFTGHTSLALSINSLCLMSFPVITVIAIWFGTRNKSNRDSLLPVWILRLYFTLSLAIGLLGAAPLLGIMPATDISSQIFLFHGPLLISFIGIFIVYRARNFVNQQKHEVEVAMTVANQERKSRLEQSQFMAMLNHEIKGPLGVLKLLIAGHTIQKRAEQQIDTVVGLLERCLMHDRMSMEENLTKKELFDPRIILHNCIEKTGEAKRFQTEYQFTSPIKSDPMLYGVIISNLLDNAIKYSPKDSSIFVKLHNSTQNNYKCLMLRVKNEIGRAGTPDPDRAFEKYYRAEEARSIPGTGLGLYLVKSFASALNGRVQFKSTQKTIEFLLCLPL